MAEMGIAVSIIALVGTGTKLSIANIRLRRVGRERREGAAAYRHRVIWSLLRVATLANPAATRALQTLDLSSDIYRKDCETLQHDFSRDRNCCL